MTQPTNAPGAQRPQTVGTTGGLAGDTTGVPAPMVEPFPEPSGRIRTAMDALQLAATYQPEIEDEVQELAAMPRPWDPATCPGPLREEIWHWLDRVAIWINTQHLWNVDSPGIPECWPAHPHLVNDLAVLAAARYYTRYAMHPGPLGDWHRYNLPTFLERLEHRLGDGCQPRMHTPRPRQERDHVHTDPGARAQRWQRYQEDLDGTAPPAPDSN